MNKRTRFVHALKAELRAFPKAAAKSLYQTTTALITLIVSDNILQFTKSPYYALSLILIGVPTALVLVYSRDETWGGEFRRLFNQTSAWVLGIIAIVLLDIPEKLLSLVTNTLSTSNAMVVIAIFLLMILPAMVFNMADLFKDNETRVPKQLESSRVGQLETSAKNTLVTGADTVLNMILKVDRSFESRSLRLTARLFVGASWVYFILGMTVILVFINTYVVSLGGGIFTELAFVVAVGSLLFTWVSGFYAEEVPRIVEVHHFDRLCSGFDTQDHPLLLAVIRMRYQAKTRLEPIYRLNRTLFGRKTLTELLVRGRGSNLD